MVIRRSTTRGRLSGAGESAEYWPTGLAADPSVAQACASISIARRLVVIITEAPLTSKMSHGPRIGSPFGCIQGRPASLGSICHVQASLPDAVRCHRQESGLPLLSGRWGSTGPLAPGKLAPRRAAGLDRSLKSIVMPFSWASATAGECRLLTDRNLALLRYGRISVSGNCVTFVMEAMQAVGER